MKIGRNDPCPCGSGKKYKKCCLMKKVTPPEDLQYRRLSELYNRLFGKLVDHAESVFGEMVATVALAEFLVWPEPENELNEDTFYRVELLFWPWLLFNWEYSSLEDENEQLNEGPEETTVAELYMQHKKIDPTSLEGRFLNAANRIQYSFHEVLAVDAGHTMTIRDVLTGSEILVQERTGSKHMHPGDILFGRAISVDGVGMFLGLADVILPPRMKPEVMRLRRHIARGKKMATNEDLYEWDVDVRQLFFDMDAALHTMPDMVNTDGDPVEFHKIVYDIDDPDLVVKNLSDLSVAESYEEIVEHAEKTPGGKIRRASFCWNDAHNNAGRNMPNTVLGHIDVDGTRLTVSVNSAKRAKTIRKEIKRRLGTASRFRLDEIGDMEVIIRNRAKSAGGTLCDDENLIPPPEVQQPIIDMYGAHWDNWADIPIPLLGGKTPRQAAKNADGRESVEALLRDAEKLAATDPFRSTFEPAMIAEVRRQLKLDKPPVKRQQGASPKVLATAVETVKSKIEVFGGTRLHEVYTEYALRLCDTIAESGVLHLHRGRPEIWAAAVVCAIARLNFLFDPSTPNHLSNDELASWFGVKVPTMSNKASMIWDALELFHDDERFCAPHITRIFEIFEDENGFLHPAPPVPGESREAIAPIPLKPGRQTPVAAKDRAKSKSAPLEGPDDKQLPLFP